MSFKVRLKDGYRGISLHHSPWRPSPRALRETTFASACLAFALRCSSAASLSRKRTCSLASFTIALACNSARSAAASAFSAAATLSRAATIVGSLWTSKLLLRPPKNPPPLRTLLPPLRTLVFLLIRSLELWCPKLESSEERRRLKKPRLWLVVCTGSGDTERFLAKMLPLRVGVSTTGSGSFTGWDLKRGMGEAD